MKPKGAKATPPGSTAPARQEPEKTGIIEGTQAFGYTPLDEQVSNPGNHGYGPLAETLFETPRATEHTLGKQRFIGFS